MIKTTLNNIEEDNSKSYKIFKPIKISKSSKSHKYEIIYSSDSPVFLQFIHSQDLGKLIMWVLETYLEKSPIILSVGEEQEV